MTQTIHAVYENGVFRPTEKVDLPDRCEVEVEVRQVKNSPRNRAWTMCTPFCLSDLTPANTTWRPVTMSINHEHGLPRHRWLGSCLG